MIARLAGQLLQRSPEAIVVDLQGVGYQVFVPLSTFYQLPREGERVALHIHTHVREDALQLYGFLTEEERQAFQLLIGISGIGPRLALNVLSGTTVDELAKAIADQDVRRLSAVPGIGRKTAERIFVELKDKIGAGWLGPGRPGSEARGGPDPLTRDVLSALVTLGYRRVQAEAALEEARRGVATPTVEVLLRAALRILSRS
ncbi:MAG: Holliday junction branch migration protein RuvA [Deltaproteobacteria bacterium]|nr:Holliday junction branch migration protein RuvA [Deltaproteobacteria bacterium]MBI3078567.1 Holliday junction branch migration protein RuvA [Deltaproteobacteria bacterium]